MGEEGSGNGGRGKRVMEGGKGRDGRYWMIGFQLWSAAVKGYGGW